MGKGSTSTLILATYNIHVGVPMGQEIGPYKVGTSDLDNIASAINETSASIVAMQEVDCEYGLALPARRRSSLLNEAKYLAAAGGFAYVFGSAQDDTGYPTDNAGYVEWGTGDRWFNNGNAHGEVGNALLTRGEFVEAPENIPLPKDAGQERRACIRAEVKIRGADRPVVVYATHLQHDNGSTRFKQMKAILDRATAEAPGPLVFIMGDLNHEFSKREPENPIRLALESGFYDLAAMAEGAGGSAAATFPADKPDVRIDFVLCSQPLKVIRSAVVRSRASDHLPLVVEVEVP